MADEKNRISSSKREIYTKLLDIAEKYTDIADTDYLRTGLFGYITESMASMMRDSTYHKDMIYRESNLNTALIPETVYNWAKMFNIPVQAATPAYADIEIQISRDYADNYIENNPISEKSKEHMRYGDSVLRHCLILDKKDQILAGDYFFALEHSIMLYKSIDETTQRVAYFAKYLTTDTFSSTALQSLISDYLTVKLTSDYIVIKARAYQYKFNKYTKQITTSTFMNKVQTYQFEDQFVAARLYYTDSSGEKEISLQYSNIDNGQDTAFYNLADKNTFELIFKSGDENFKPSANSSITLYILTTKGAQIPSYYSGDAIIVFGSNDLKALPVNIQFNPTDILGGKDAPSVNKIKQTIISELSTRKTITTKNDLNNYFNLLTTLIEDVNDGRVNFIKQRDDIIRRMYNAYLLIRDNTDERTASSAAAGYISSCVPTNTISTNIEAAIGDNEVSYTKTDITGLYKFAYPCFSTTGSHALQLTQSGESDYYLCPFVIFVYDVGATGLRKVQYIYNLVDQTTKLSYNDNAQGTSGAYYAIPVSANLNRSFDMANIDSKMNAEDHYTLSLVFTTNFDANETTPVLNNRGLSITLGNSSISVFNGDGNISFYSEQAQDTGDSSIFTTTMEITLPVNSSSEFNISDGYISTLLLTEAKNSIEPTCECSINGLFSVDGEDLGINVRTDDKLTFYSVLDTIMDSNIIEDKTNTGNIIGLSDVPVVHSSFFHSGNSEAKNSGFIRQLFTYIKILKENLGKLETSTFFNIKFYNTYGPSFRYNTVTTNIRLTMKIALYESAYNDPDTTSLRRQIKSYIRRLVDQMNLSNSGIRVSSIISAITSAETFGKYIDYIEFVELNGSDRQYITPLDVDNDIGVAPEWLNLDAEYLENSSDEGSALDSGIYFVKGASK